MYELVEVCEEEDVREAQEVSSKAQDIQAGDSPYVPRPSSSHPVETVRRSTRLGAGRGRFREPQISEFSKRKRRQLPGPTAATPHCDTPFSPRESLSLPFPSATASSLQWHDPPEESNDAIGLSHYLQVAAPKKMILDPSNVANGAPPRRLQTHDPSLQGNPRNVIFASPKYPLTFYVLPYNNPSLPTIITVSATRLNTDTRLEEASWSPWKRQNS